MKKEEGSILTSVLLFVSLISLMFGSLGVLVRNQTIQLRQLQDSYYAKSMIEMTTTLLEEEIETVGEVSTGQVTFTDGIVEVSKLDEDQYELTASLSNDFSSEEVVFIPSKFEESNQLEKKSEEDIVQEDSKEQ